MLSRKQSWFHTWFWLPCNTAAELKCCVLKVYVIKMLDGVGKYVPGIISLAALVFIGLLMFTCEELEF